jgi:hypothetical protein
MSLLGQSGDRGRHIDFIAEQYLHFEIQGRLGNQLFGLSDAYNLGKHFKRKVLLDISSVTAEYGKPEWVRHAGQWDWAEVVETEISHSEEQGYKRVNIGTSDPLVEAPNCHFHGFSPSVKAVESAGLFKRGKFPFPSDSKELSDTNQLALCIRRGDYHQNPHLGILPPKYYKKALSKFLPLQPCDKIVVFCDSRDETIRFLDANEIPFDEINENVNALDALRDLAKSTKIIAANSTFSFWGSYFSDSITYFPEPFYISQPKWGKKLVGASQVINYTRIPRINYLTHLIMRKFKSYF